LDRLGRYRRPVGSNVYDWPMTASFIFEADNLHYSYGKIPALNGLALNIAEGQRLAFLGANGSGKSTLLRILDALYFPSQGQLRYRGTPLTERLFEDENFAYPFRRDVALVFQNPDVQLFCATVYEEVAFGPLQMKWPKDTIRERVEQTLALLKITHLADRIPHHLSGGEKKKVALASALILDPKVILLDEPAAGLDPRSQMQIIDFLIEWGSQSKTIVTATHDLHTLQDIADQCVVFENGAIIAAGAPHDILHDHDLLRRANLMHSHRSGRIAVPGHIHQDD
jgi:cobalt/nickel transport system ATP-binding protein